MTTITVTPNRSRSNAAAVKARAVHLRRIASSVPDTGRTAILREASLCEFLAAIYS